MNREITIDDIPKPLLVGNPLLIFTTGFVSLCVFLFGYDQGYFSSILTNQYFKDYFNNPTALEIGTVVAILEIGALISSLSLGMLADKLGRKRSTRLGSFLFCIGGAVQTFSTSMSHLGIGRFISGVGVGYLSGTAPTYMSEIASPEMRGFLGSAQFTGNILGYSSSIWIDFACSYIESDLSFRIPLALQVLFGIILFCGTFVLVESPRWLLEHDHDAEGLVVLADLLSGGNVDSENAKEEFRAIKQSVLLGRLEGHLSYWDTIKRYPKRVFIGCSAQMFAQLNGINVISYYAPLVFEQSGWIGREAVLMTGINSIFYVFSTFIPWRLSETWGRTPLLISGGITMGLAMFLISFFSYSSSSDSNSPKFVVLSVILYMSAFGFSWGPIAWLIGPEVLPNKARASGAALATATNWLCNFIVGESAPVLLELIRWRLYIIHGTICLISAIVVAEIYPETKGLSLEDMDSIFDDRSSMKSSHSGLSSSMYGSIDDIESQNVRVTATNAQIARNPLQTNNNTVGAVFDSTQLFNPSSNSLLAVTSNQQVQPMQSVISWDTEPPDLHAIYKYKTDDSNSIAGHLRRGSEAVSSIFRFKPSNTSYKQDGDNRSVVSDVSERFINTSNNDISNN